MRSIMSAIPLSCAFVLSAALGALAQAPTLPYDHIHLNVPDQAKAVEWYQKNFGGTPTAEAPDRLMFGTTRLIFLKNANGQPSAGSSIDHIGFSFADLDAKMKEFEAAGVKIVTPVRDVPNLFKLGFVEDPWGRRSKSCRRPGSWGSTTSTCAPPIPPRCSHGCSLRRRAHEAERTDRRGQPQRRRSATCGCWRSAASRRRATARHRSPLTRHQPGREDWERRTAGVKERPNRVRSRLGLRPIQFAYIEGPAGTKIELVQRPR
jgi:predicted enzyme related to lactoylglutathione lyase